MQAELILLSFLQTLSDKELVILSLSYGLNSKGLTLTPTEIAKLINSKTPNVIRIRNGAVDKLRSSLFVKTLLTLKNANTPTP